MKSKITFIIILSIIVNFFAPTSIFANEKSTKTIVINLNRTSLESMTEIKSLNKQISKRGYIGLMNIRGDGGNGDDRSYASIGAGVKSNVSLSGEWEIFKEYSNEESTIYSKTVGKKPYFINMLGINKVLNHNKTKGQYNSTLGSLGQAFIDNNMKVAVLGNSDIGFDDNEKNRSFSLMAMDEHGRIQLGKFDDLNIKDSTMPFGLRTDYNKLKESTLKFYEDSDILFVDLGDTYRLDRYKTYLTQNTYDLMKKNIYNNISKYLEYIFKLYENDNIYIISAYPSTLDYSNKRRLTPIIKFTDNKKGLLYSSTTRRKGVISNIDLGVDLLNNYNLQNPNMIGKKLSYIENSDNINYLEHDYAKIVTMSQNRVAYINYFVTLLAILLILIVLSFTIKNKLPKDKIIFNILNEFIKLGMIIPLASALAPLSNTSNKIGLFTSIVIYTLLVRLLGYILYKNNNIKEIGLYAFLVTLLIAIDSILGTPLMKNSIMGYDALIGSRYYGIGNEFEGITVAAPILALSVICTYKKIPKWLLSIFLMFILITSAHPAMGANVGGAISESIAYMVFIALICDIKIDYKKLIILLVLVALVVGGFAISDIIMGTESHLSLFITRILTNGPSEIIQTFTRKISMNIKLSKTSIWAKLLLIDICILSWLIFKLRRTLEIIKKEYSILYKGLIASTVGCIVTLLVNDSGIVAAGTASIYIIIPLIILLLNINFIKNQAK